jgi:hypothetical protein
MAQIRSSLWLFDEFNCTIVLLPIIRMYQEAFL